MERQVPLEGAREEALTADRPVVLEVKTDPDVPPLPPHVMLQQARNFATALAYGDPDASGVLRGTARQ
ncbi:thiamine pyrophosphate-requiring protein, partial [Mycobacterium tuberculosis]|nr:thiamine pyrophosphate-requiring protein [Mycobacterium tuberculosis]